MEPTLTPEQIDDVKSRVEEFRKRHIANVEELEVDFTLYPQYVQIGPNVFATQSSMQLADRKYASIPSPLANDGGEIVDA